MAKAPISAKFARFADRTTKGDFDKARKQESMAGGCPLPVGTRGCAIVSEINCKETKIAANGEGGYPMVLLKLEVETPENFRGKSLSGPGLMFVIKDSEKQTEADAWARMLDCLESCGLPRDIRTGYQEFEEVVNYFTEEPRRVTFEVRKDTYAGNQSGKTVSVFEYIPEGEEESAETKYTPPTEDDPDAQYVTYMGKKCKVVEYNRDEDTYTLQIVDTGRIKEGISASRVEK